MSYDLSKPRECCACGKVRICRNFVAMSFTSPVAGTGWGCFKCGLPMNGAMAVVCDMCVEDRLEIKKVIKGNASIMELVAVDSYEHEPFDHDMSKHPEAATWQ